jgi:hypothetical protein
MKNNFKNTLRTIEELKTSRVTSDDKINSIWYSTREQMIHLLNKQKNWEEINVQIFLDDNLIKEQKWIAYIAMWLLPIKEFKRSIILPEDYDYMMKWSNVSQPDKIDFESLFQWFDQESFINYQDAIDQLGAEEAYRYIEMYLARKKFMSEDNEADIIIHPSHVKGLNWIYTKWEVDKRSNRNKLFTKIEYNQ